MGDYRIKQARDAKGWTQADLTKAIGAIIPVRRVKTAVFRQDGIWLGYVARGELYRIQDMHRSASGHRRNYRQNL